MVEKIDIVGTSVCCYDEQMNYLKEINLNEFQNVDFGYLDGAKIFSINISNPIKRVVKFSEINNVDTDAVFVEYPYADMTTEQQADFDSFVQQAETL